MACSIAKLRVLDAPKFSLEKNLNLSSLFANSFAIPALPSVEPSSTIITSKSLKVCFSTEPRQRLRYFSTLYIGIIMLISGLFISPINHSPLFSPISSSSSTSSMSSCISVTSSVAFFFPIPENGAEMNIVP